MNKRSTSPTVSTPQVDFNQVLNISEQMIPANFLEQLLLKTKHIYYSRLLPPILILWGFLYQRLNDDHSCDAAWSFLTSPAIQERLGHSSDLVVCESTSAYCQARHRLPLSVAQGLLQRTADQISDDLGEEARWHGQRVNLFDGSTLQLAASSELITRYGRPHNQKAESHWPLMRLMAGFDLYTGAANGVVEGPYRDSEHVLAVRLILQLGPDWLHVGDRYLGAYHVLQAVSAAHSQAVVRLNAVVARHLVPGGLPVGSEQAIVWQRSPYDQVDPDLPTPGIPGRLIHVRLEKNGFRPIDLYLFTTLTDAEAYPMEAIIALYGYRWHIELDLRHVKTTLAMERLAGKSVDIVQKELWFGLLAYNLIRGFMAKAAHETGVAPCQLSLAQCWRRIQLGVRALPASPTQSDLAQVVAIIVRRCGNCRLPVRNKERFEPRAVWGPVHHYPRIVGSRDQAREADYRKIRVPTDKS